MNRDKLNSFYFPNLDGFRFLAFCLVFLNHAFTLEKSTVDFIGFLKEGLLKNGASGVSFFFVLSGFLITYIIVVKQEDLTFSLRNFYLRRAIRIWPLYFFCLDMTYIFTLLPFQSTTLSQNTFHWSYWVFLSNFHMIDKIHQSIPIILPLDITWSISIEEQFYLLWPLLFLIIKPYHARVAALISLIVFSLAFRIFTAQDHPVHYFHSFSALYELSTGGLLALLVSNSKPNIRHDLDAIYIKAIYLVGIIWVLLNGEQFLVKEGRAIQPLFFAFIIYEQCFCTQSFYKLGNNRQISWLGKYTYGMYLLHPMSLWGAQHLFLYLNIYNEIVVAFIGFLITVLSSIIVYHLVEQKILKLRTRFQ